MLMNEGAGGAPPPEAVPAADAPAAEAAATPIAPVDQAPQNSAAVTVDGQPAQVATVEAGAPRAVEADDIAEKETSIVDEMKKEIVQKMVNVGLLAAGEAKAYEKEEFKVLNDIWAFANTKEPAAKADQDSETVISRDRTDTKSDLEKQKDFLDMWHGTDDSPGELKKILDEMAKDPTAYGFSPEASVKGKKPQELIDLVADQQLLQSFRKQNEIPLDATLNPEQQAAFEEYKNIKLTPQQKEFQEQTKKTLLECLSAYGMEALNVSAEYTSMIEFMGALFGAEGYGSFGGGRFGSAAEREGKRKITTDVFTDEMIKGWDKEAPSLDKKLMWMTTMKHIALHFNAILGEVFGDVGTWADEDQLTDEAIALHMRLLCEVILEKGEGKMGLIFERALSTEEFTINGEKIEKNPYGTDEFKSTKDFVSDELFSHFMALSKHTDRRKDFFGTKS